MGQSSDSAETQIFMAAFQELRNRVADNTSFLVDEALRTRLIPLSQVRLYVVDAPV
jgi:hypothetical protein